MEKESSLANMEELRTCWGFSVGGGMEVGTVEVEAEEDIRHGARDLDTVAPEGREEGRR